MPEKRLDIAERRSESGAELYAARVSAQLEAPDIRH